MEPVEDESGIALAVSEELSNGEPSNVKMIGAIIDRGYVHEAGKYSIQLRGTKDDEVPYQLSVSSYSEIFVWRRTMAGSSQ